jgi:hypothetical protein
MNENDLPLATVSPIVCKGKRELELMLYNIEKKVSESAEWGDRIASLQQLQGLALGGEGHNPLMIQTLNKIKEDLGSAASDLRSSLVKEACVTIAVLAEHMVELAEYIYSYPLNVHILTSPPHFVSPCTLQCFVWISRINNSNFHRMTILNLLLHTSFVSCSRVP